MMKKITLQFTLFLTLSILSISAFAQTTYYEDFRYENEGRGFTVQRVALGGQASADVGKRVGDIVDATDSSPVFDESSRPAVRIPQGGTRDQTTISLKNVSGSSPSIVNHEIEAWVMMTNQDLSAINNPSVTFWTQQRYAYGAGTTLTIWVSENYTHGNSPNTATWTNETTNILGNIATSEVAPQTYVKGELNLSAYTGTSVTVAFKMETDNTAYSSGVSQHGTFYISDVAFGAAPEDVAIGAFSALNTSATGQTNIFNTPSASIDNANFSNTSKWADVLTTATGVPRLASGVLIPIGEGYKFEVSGAYNPIQVSEVRYILANGTSNKGAPDESKWIVQGSNDDVNWDDLCAPVGMFSGNSGAGTEYPIALTTSQAYRYYRFVLAAAWTPNQIYTALHQLDFTTVAAVASVEDDLLELGVNVYPNPTNNVINVKSIDSNIQIKKVDLMNIMGKVIYSSNNTNPIDVSGISKGMYLLKISSENGGVFSKKIIVN